MSQRICRCAYFLFVYAPDVSRLATVFGAASPLLSDLCLRLTSTPDDFHEPQDAYGGIELCAGARSDSDGCRAVGLDAK